MLVIANETVVGDPLLDAHPRARGALAGELPDHLPAERPEPRRASRGRAAPAARARDSARRGHRRARPGLAPGPVHGRDAGDPRRARSTRSSSRPSRPSARRGCARTSSSGSTTTRAAGRARRRRRSRSVSCMSAHAEAHHGPPVANQSSRVDSTTLGMLLFIASEIMLFGSFFTAYFFVRVVDGAPEWPPPPFHLPVFVAGVNTMILVTSSFTMHWALQAIKRGNRAGHEGRARADARARADLPAHAGARVLADRVRAARRRVRLDLLRPDGPPRRPRLRRADAADASRRCAPSAAISRRSTTTASRSPGSTGTSST